MPRTKRARVGVRRRVFAAVLVLAASGALLPARQAPSQPASEDQEPVAVFRSGIEAVQMHVYVTDADGNPVTDLAADDFEVLEDRVPRPVTTFAFVDIPITESRGRAATWPVEPDVATNDGPEGRLYLFLLDEVEVEFALRTRAFLRRFLEEHFGPDDVAAVTLSGRGLRSTGQGFTGNTRLLLDAIDRFSGGFGGGSACESQERFLERGGERMSRGLPFEQWARVDSRMDALRSAIEMMAPLPGRKVILYFTHCIGYSMFATRDYSGGVLTRGGEHAHAAMAAATRGNVVVYPMDPAGLTFDVDLDRRADMAALADLTGGFALTGSNRFAEAFDRVVRENSTYYVLGFNSAYTRRDGRYVDVQVRVRRPGLQVRARDGYVAPLGERRRREAEAAASPAVSALASPAATRGLPLRVSAAPFKGTGDEAAVSIVVEVGVWDLPLVERDGRRQTTVEVSYVPIDASDRAYPGGVHALTVSAVPGQPPPPAEEQWLRVVSQLALPPGQFQVRVGAGAGTRTGSVVYDLDVPEFGKRPLELSGLVLSAASVQGTVTLRPHPPRIGTASSTPCRPPSCRVPLVFDAAPSGEDPLLGALASPPTTRRAFERTDRLALFAELYENRPAGSDHRLTLAVELRGDDGTRIPLAAQTQPAAAARRPSGGYGFGVEAALRDVPPGHYTLHVEAHSSEGRGGTASRALPIEIR